MLSKIKHLHQDAEKAFNQGLYKKAHQYLMSILEQDKYFADAYFLLAMIASAHHNINKAIELIQQANTLEPKNLEYLSQLAKHYALANDHVKAFHFAELAVNNKNITDIKSPLTFDTLGVAYSQIGLHDKAVSFFEKAVALNNKNPSYFFNLGSSLKFIGDINGAKTAFEKTIELAPNFYKAHAALTGLGGITLEKNHISTLEKIFSQIQNSDEKLYIGHALAREYEALNHFDKAFYYLDTAKNAKLNKFEYSIEEDKALFESIENHFKSLKTTKRSGYETDEPIFVVGMPRTGTTLVERIISQHSEVTAAGELQNFGMLFKKMAQTSSNRVIDPETIAASKNIDFEALGKAYIDSTRAITGKTRRFVDKMPLNILYVGFILQALPKVKIVCLDRNPLDTIVSNFRQLFAVNQSYYNYSYSLESTAEYYLLFNKLAKLWLSLFPNNFYFINYEKLVNDPLSESNKLIKFCSLSWQENCVNIEKNLTPVATASALQVRSPISNRSVGNWKKYEQHLGRVKVLLNSQIPV